MKVLARFGKDKCHICGKFAVSLNEYDVGGCWHGITDKLTYVPVCEDHQFGCCKVPGLDGVSWCGGSGGPGTPQERSVSVKARLDKLFPEQQHQLVMF